MASASRCPTAGSSSTSRRPASRASPRTSRPLRARSSRRARATTSTTPRTPARRSPLGNLPELCVVICALHAGEVVVAQTSIIGSLFANGLLVLGLVIVVGAGAADGPCMHFRRRLPQDTGTLLLVTVFIIVVVGV